MICENEQAVSKRRGQPRARAAAVASAVAAAGLYALSTPLSKVLLADVSSGMMAALLYLGAGAGMALLGLIRTARRASRGTAPTGEGLRRGDAPYVAGMVAFDIAAPILLMSGLATMPAESVSLLNNFEIVATALIALALFGEPVPGRLWAAIGLITAACALLSAEGAKGLSLSPGALSVLAASACWGFENNCTNRLSSRDPLQVVVVKGFGSGTGALLVALAAGEALPGAVPAAGALALGFVAYGLSIFFYVSAQRGLGAARTSAYYAASPFIGVAVSWALFREAPSVTFIVALVLMVAGGALAVPGADDAPGEG